VYNKKDGNHSIERMAENDLESSFYRSHVIWMMRDNADNPSPPEERTIMWY
jgi:hypothetical protein